MTSCARSATVEKAEQIWNHLTTAHGVQPDTVAYNSLLNVYARNQWNSRRRHKSLYRGYDPWAVIQEESGLNEGNPRLTRYEQFYDEARAIADQMRLLPDEAFFSGIDNDSDYWAIEDDEAEGFSVEEQIQQVLGNYEGPMEIEGEHDSSLYPNVSPRNINGSQSRHSTIEISHSSSDDEDVHILDLIREDGIQSFDESSFKESEEKITEVVESEESESELGDEVSIFSGLDKEEEEAVREWELEVKHRSVFEMPPKPVRKLSKEEKRELAYDALLRSKDNISRGLMALETLDAPAQIEKRNIERAETLVNEMDEIGIPLDTGTLNNLLRVYALAFRLNRAKDVFYSQFAERGLVPDSFTYAAMIEMYVRVGRMEDAVEIASNARKEFGDHVLNCSTYGNLIDGFARKKQFEECWKLLRTMRRLKYKPYEKHMRLLRIRCVQEKVRPPDGLVPRDPNAWRKPKVIGKALKSVYASKKNKKLTDMQVHAMQRM